MNPRPRLLHFCGDSHLMVVEHAIERGLFVPHTCRTCSVGGATAVGLRHPTSRSQALPTFRTALELHEPGVIPVFQLGEVDCGFVIWVRADRYGETIEQQLDESLGAYRNFLCEMRDRGYADLVVSSAILPTIRDGQFDGEVAHLRAMVKATQRERTDLTLDYNSRLAAICAAEGMTFMDLTPDLIDPDTRLVRDSLRHRDPADHHLDPEAAGAIWSKRLLAIVDGASAPQEQTSPQPDRA